MVTFKIQVLQSLEKFRRIHVRDKFLLAAGTSGMVQRLICTALGFLTTGLLTRMLGRDAFGAWATLSVLPQWIALADLGIGQSLSIKLGHLFGSNDNRTSRILIWSAFWTQLVIVLVCAGVILVITSNLEITRFFIKIDSVTAEDLNKALLWLALGTVLTLPFRSYTGILMARQRPVDCAVLGIASAAIVFLATLVAYKASIHLLEYSAVFTFASFISCIVGLVWLFRFRFPELWKPFEVDWVEGRKLTAVGFIYFLGGITWVINSTVDSLMLARMVGPGVVTDYNLTLKLFTLSSLITTVAGSGLASAYAEAVGRRDIAWIRSRYRVTIRSAAAAGLVSSITIGLATPWAVSLWSGGEAKPNPLMIVGFTFWFAIFPMNQMIAFVLSGLNRANDMLRVGLVTTAINIPITYLLIKTLGGSGAAVGTGIAIFFAGVIYAHRKVQCAFQILDREFSLSSDSLN